MPKFIEIVLSINGMWTTIIKIYFKKKKKKKNPNLTQPTGSTIARHLLLPFSSLVDTIFFFFFQSVLMM